MKGHCFRNHQRYCDQMQLYTQNAGAGTFGIALLVGGD